MQRICLEAAVILGIVIPQIFCISTSVPPSDCLAAVDTCMSDLCKIEQAFQGGICEDGGCQINSFEVCNLTIQTVMERFPSLHGCVCAWEEELCDSIQALATQCHQKPVYDGAGSCLDQMRVCVSDAVCNRFLAPVLQTCMAEPCDRQRCHRVTQQFYGSMPHNVAEMLVMCECKASDQSCLHMKTALHSGTCGDETTICQDTLNHCVEDKNCRHLLKTFRTKCWSPEDAQCSDSDLQHDECFTRMDPALILGADSECKMAIVATLGTALHHSCTCRGVHNEDLPKCNMIHDVLHNRSRFMTSWNSSRGPSKAQEINTSEQGLPWSHGTFLYYLLYAFATVFLVGVVILMPLAVVSTIWKLRRRDKTKYHHPQKSTCGVIL